MGVMVRSLIFKILILFFLLSCTDNDSKVELKIFNAEIFNYVDLGFHHSGNPILKFNISMFSSKKSCFVLSDNMFLVSGKDTLVLDLVNRDKKSTLCFKKNDKKFFSLKTKMFDLNNVIEKDKVSISTINFLTDSKLIINVNSEKFILYDSFPIYFVDVNNPTTIIRGDLQLPSSSSND